MEKSTSGGIVIPTASEASYLDEKGKEIPFIRVMVTRVSCE